jgi:hypothetical protein
MKEEFRDIEGYEGHYQVSNLGRVKSLSRVIINSRGQARPYKERILKGYNPSNNIPTKRDYLRVTLRINKTTKIPRIHNLVAMAFLNHKPDGHKIVIDHIDNDPLNNRVDNLQLISHRENTSKDKKGGTSKYTGVCWCKSTNKWKSNIYINGKSKYLGRFDDEYEAHLAYQRQKCLI